MKCTIFYLLAITACASAAPVELSDKGQEIVDAVKPLFSAQKIAKMVRIIASQGDKSRDFVASLAKVSPQANTCAFTQAQAIGKKVETKEIQPEAAPDAILAACEQYKSELQPVFDAYKAAQPEMNGASSTFFNDMPQSVQNLIQNYNKLSQEIQANPDLPKDTATFGPKWKALTDEFRAISEADRKAVVDKLPYTKEFLLPDGSHYADLNQVLDFLDAKTAGQPYDETALKAKAKALLAYWVQHAEEDFNYINQKIDDYEVNSDVKASGDINKVAAQLGKIGSNYAKMLFKAPQFNKILNHLVDMGSNPDATGEMSLAVMPQEAAPAS